MSRNEDGRRSGRTLVNNLYRAALIVDRQKIKTAEKNANAEEKEEMTEDAKQNEKYKNTDMGWGTGR